MPLTRLDKLLKGSAADRLQTLVRRAAEMGDLTEALRAALPPDAAPHLLAANRRGDDELVIVCDSAPWAARLRFDSEALLKAARVRRCTVKVGTG